MASNLKKITELSARVENALHQFSDTAEAGYAPEMVEKKKKKNPLVRAGIAGGAVAGSMVGNELYSRYRPQIAAKTAQLKTKAAPAVAQAREAGFKGMRKTAEGLDAVAKGVKKGAGFLRRKSWKVRGFSAGELAQRLVRIDAGLRKFGI